MDDIILAGNDQQSLTSFKTFCDTQSKLKDLGKVKYFLGMKVARTKKQMEVCTRCPRRCWFYGHQTSSFPMDQNLKLRKFEGDLLDNPSVHRRLFARLIYLTNTCSDLPFSVEVLSQLMDQPRHPHLHSSI